MTDDSDARILQRALEKWGEEAQIVMAIEECAELTTELTRLYRGRADDSTVSEEIADAQIMLEQLALIFGEDAVADERARKLSRLEDRLNEQNND